MTFARASLITKVGSSFVVAALAASSVLLVVGRDARGGSGWYFTNIERCLMRKTNDARARRGLPRLSRDKQMGYVARRHAESMKQAGSIWHDPYVGNKVTRWYSIGQNTARGGRCRRLFRRFMRSSSHRANILGPWRYVAVGARRGGGRIYVQQLFETRRDPGNIWGWPSG